MGEWNSRKFAGFFGRKIRYTSKSGGQLSVSPGNHGWSEKKARNEIGFPLQYRQQPQTKASHKICKRQELGNLELQCCCCCCVTSSDSSLSLLHWDEKAQSLVHIWHDCPVSRLFFYFLTFFCFLPLLSSSSQTSLFFIDIFFQLPKIDFRSKRLPSSHLLVSFGRFESGVSFFYIHKLGSKILSRKNYPQSSMLLKIKLVPSFRFFMRLIIASYFPFPI